MTKNPDKFSGTWRITEMEIWDQEFIDLVVPGHFTFDGFGKGFFQFGAIEGQMIYGVGSDLDFKWNGTDEMDEISGHGWCELVDKNMISGEIYFDNEEESTFKAQRK